MDMVRLGVLGCGNMARTHLRSVGGNFDAISPDLREWGARLQVRGLMDVDLSKAETQREEFHGDYATDDPERIFNDPDIDAVLITTWHDTHAPYSLRALESGKHVLIEKPMAMTEAECDSILEAVENSGLKYMVAFRCRFARGARDVRQEIPEPDNVIAFARVGGIWGEQIWAQDPIKGGGQILSQGCHVVDMMFYLAGAEPQSVYATGGVFHHSRPEVIDTINASIRFANGSVGAFIGGDGGTGNLLQKPAYASCPFYVLAVDAGRSAVAFDHGQNARFESSVPEDEWKPPYSERYYTEEIGHDAAGGIPDILPTLARCIIQDEEPPANAYDGARTTRFILRAFESARTGEIITF
ncbi:MAG: Gfo/Idh/MocA family oxidoreductase [Armatimonadetes bacterium]|nr:Gfo/Idh/MocA family oxidoreductase [Armatimonadota bacterium]